MLKNYNMSTHIPFWISFSFFILITFYTSSIILPKALFFLGFTIFLYTKKMKLGSFILFLSLILNFLLGNLDNLDICGLKAFFNWELIYVELFFIGIIGLSVSVIENNWDFKNKFKGFIYSSMILFAMAMSIIPVIIL